jgi:probable HAF family extracellular repeat protein
MFCEALFITGRPGKLLMLARTAFLLSAGTLLAYAQPQYTVNDLGTLGGDQSVAAGINKLGQVAGTSTTASGASHAFRTAPNSSINPTMDDLGTLGGADSTSVGLNASGQVVGASQNVAGVQRSFRTAPNGPINPATDDLGTLGGPPPFPGALDTLVLGINDAGSAVGTSRAAGGFLHAFRTAPNMPINPATDDLGAFGGTDAVARSINASGDIAGSYLPPNADYPSGFLLKSGGMISIGFLGLGGIGEINDSNQIALGLNQEAALWRNGKSTIISSNVSAANGINNAGDLVGFTAPFGAFLYKKGALYNLNDLILPNSGWTLTRATGINDLGQITGNGTINGQTHAFRLDPALPCAHGGCQQHLR